MHVSFFLQLLRCFRLLMQNEAMADEMTWGVGDALALQIQLRIP
jgi:hypothetical protein